MNVNSRNSPLAEFWHGNRIWPTAVAGEADRELISTVDTILQHWWAKVCQNTVLLFSSFLVFAHSTFGKGLCKKALTLFDPQSYAHEEVDKLKV